MNKILGDVFKKIPHQFHKNNTYSLIYKGFKITNVNNEYFIEDTRFKDNYTEVSKDILELFNKIGVIKGADFISNKRNIKRVDNYHKKLEKLYADRKKFYTELNNKCLEPDRREFLKKRIKNCTEGIKNTVDLIFYYKVKVQQFKEKYN